MKTLKATLGAVVLAAITAAAATTLEWDQSPPDDSVTQYIVEHRESPSGQWSRVEVEATKNRVTIPESAFGRWFRIAAVNSFGVGDWTEPVKLPDRVRGLKLVLEITP